MTDQNHVWGEKVQLYTITVLAALVGAVVVGYINTYSIAYLSGTSVQSLTNGNFYQALDGLGWVAGVTEPVITKMAPVAVSVEFFISTRRRWRIDIPGMGFQLGALAGFTFGILELYVKMFQLGNEQLDSFFVWQDPSFSALLVVPVVMHIAWGAFAGSVVARSWGDDGEVDRGEWIALVVSYLVLVIIHGLVYNSYLVERGYLRDILEVLGL